MVARRLVLLVQLPIPPGGMQPAAGNVPLAGAYLKLFAERAGLGRQFDIELFPSPLADTLGDQGLVAEIVARRPWLVGLTCYLWNVDRSLWLANQLKRQCPTLKIVLGGPEITPDNAWVLDRGVADYAVFGEGEQTFSALMAALTGRGRPVAAIDGLARLPGGTDPRPRTPLASLDVVSSPYLAGMLDVAAEKTMFLETARGCRFKCKFCYYPKQYAGQHYLSNEQIAANLDWADEHGVEEVFLLDPTLNQRRGFHDFLRLLATGNRRRRFRYAAELRAETIDAPTARLLRQANFAEVEVGLQSVDPCAQRQMGRRVNLPAFVAGCRALIDAGIRVRTDLILGLPGDTADSVHRGIDFLLASQAYSEVQVFNLAVLPGTAFRRQAGQLGLVYQDRPPYYVLETPTLDVERMAALMADAQQAFGTEYDPLPPPAIALPKADGPSCRAWQIDLDQPLPAWPVGRHPAQAMLLWFRGTALDRRADQAEAIVRRLLAENPHTTLQVTLEPTGDPASVSPTLLRRLHAACFQTTNYLDRFYSLQPGEHLAAKRLVVVLPAGGRRRLGPRRVGQLAAWATVVSRRGQSG